MTVADYVARFLVSIGVRHVFGFQGSAVLKLVDSMVGTGNIEYVQNFNEQASAFAADAYARVRGDLGVAVATSGPGAINLIGGIANAYFDSVPVLFITGQEHSTIIQATNGARQNGFQDTDIVSMVKGITKYAVCLTDPYSVRHELEKAIYIAQEGRKGSVLIDIPLDIQFAEIDEKMLEAFPPPIHSVWANADQCMDKIIQLIEHSKRPIFLAGGGVRSSKAQKNLELVAKKYRIPIVTTLQGIDTCESAVGMGGLYGNTAANMAISYADCIIALGVRFAKQHIGKDKTQYASEAVLIHVDLDEKELGRTFMQPDIAVHADIKTFLTALKEKQLEADYSPWHTQVKEWKNSFADTICTAESEICPVRFVREVIRYMKPGQIAVSDVGVHQMWVAQAFCSHTGQRLLNSGGFGAMGYALPAAVGASYLSDFSIVCFTGDGGLQMNLQELNTLSLRHNNIKCIVFNNGTLGMMRMMQNTYYGGRSYGTTKHEFSCPDLEKLADCYRLNYAVLCEAENLGSLKDVFADNQPWLVDVHVNGNTKVLNRYNDTTLTFKRA